MLFTLATFRETFYTKIIVQQFFILATKMPLEQGREK
jgi:hypothetical protein